MTATHVSPPHAHPLLPVLGGEIEVPLLDGTRVRYAGLDYAATAPALPAVADRVAAVLPYAGSVHRGAGLPSRAASALYEQARERVAARLGARSDDHVIFTRNTTDAANLLAACVPPAAGDVVTLDVEHHANLLPWRRTKSGHRVVEHAPTIAETLDAPRPRSPTGPRAAARGHRRATSPGEVDRSRQITPIARRHGARTFVDAAQLAPHRAVDVAALDIDYLALSGHKTYAPYGAGVLVGRRDWLDGAEPYLAGGGAVQEVTTRDVAWSTGPRRHEAGTPNLAGAVALATALDALADVVDEHGADAREPHERALRDRLLTRPRRAARRRGALDLGRRTGAHRRRRLRARLARPGASSAGISNEHGVGVRTGRFCAHPLLARFGGPAGAVRASFGVGSRLDDVERLIAGVERFLDRGPRFEYALEADGWAPRHDTRDVTSWPGLDPGSLNLRERRAASRSRPDRAPARRGVAP